MRDTLDHADGTTLTPTALPVSLARNGRVARHSPSFGAWGGFTVIELMIVLAIAAILSTVVVPSFLETARSVRASSASDDLSLAASLARSEAMVRNAEVRVCASNDTKNCNTNDWTQGWIVKTGSGGGGGEVLRRWRDPAENLDIDNGSGSDPAATLTFDADGSLDGGQETLVLSIDQCNGLKQYRISVPNFGQPQVTREQC